MLIAGILAVLIFGIVRFLATRFGSSRFPLIYGIVAAALFLAGIGTHKLMHSGESAGPAPVVAVVSPANAPQTTANKLNLTTTQIAHLTPLAGNHPLGSLDALTTSPSDTVNQTNNEFAVGTPIYARGWAADAIAKVPLRGIVLLVDFKRVIDATAGYGGDRPDVAKALGLATVEFTGFSGVQIPTAHLAKGTHSLTLAGITDDGKHYILTTAVIKFTLT
jgi:hypothetical protein